ncbi:MAG: Iojap protein [Candidatus Ozemobacter sibiricus]|uniref:Ribosomal silencing factor RsfS n=1 Tax=Candidatus Ozemobacter sibiricus TaxID=2268124 RepID=A0A367ZPF3_9BACT|nr:MAG: Iojap protein [Candidatus Ozemobacter sibiricus]
MGKTTRTAPQTKKATPSPAEDSPKRTRPRTAAAAASQAARRTAGRSAAKSAGKAARASRARVSAAEAVAPTPAPATPQLSERVRKVLKVLDEKQVENLVVLAVGDLVGYADFFLIGTGRSQPHVEAMADGVLAALKVKGARGLPVEKDPGSTWVLIDGGEFVLHLFQPEARQYYALEDLWSDAPRLAF